ncbi:hypothetical protein IAU60_004456 [Kwoniella sp. DSM 27419]
MSQQSGDIRQYAQHKPSQTELHLLYVLLDSNLPTGGFVSSSGLESFAKHGFLTTSSPAYGRTVPPDVTKQSDEKKRSVAQGVTDFAWAEVGNYASTTASFVVDAWRLVDGCLRGVTGSSGGDLLSREVRDHDGSDPLDKPNRLEDDLDEQRRRMEALEHGVQDVVNRIARLDRYHESTSLSHVARRSSKAQGVAILTLFTRGLSRPPGPDAELAGLSGDQDPTFGGAMHEEETWSEEQEHLAKMVVDLYKRMIRAGRSPGHLAVCWGVMTAALGLSIDRAIHIHLFLHARSLLSSAVRLNLIGPYLSSQLLLHPFRQIIDHHVQRAHPRENRQSGSSPPAGCSTGLLDLFPLEPEQDKKTRGASQTSHAAPSPGSQDLDADAFWSWTDAAESGPATTWPLGEVLMGRHDLQHSRIFNS